MRREQKTQMKAAALKKGIPALSWLLLGLAALGLLLAISSCAPIAPAEESAPAVATPGELAKEVTVPEAAAMRERGAFILDVREQDEWDAGHIPGAVLIPLGQLESRLSEVPKDQEIVVVCRSGNRSAAGRDVLLNAGYPQVTSMAGGVTDWQSQGLPIATGP